MSIGRITMMEWTSEEAMLAAEKHYLSIQKEAFPNAELVINVQTGPCSQMSLAIYPSYEAAEKTLAGREEYQASQQGVVKDSFYYKGDLRMFLQKPDSIIIATYSYKDVKIGPCMPWKRRACLAGNYTVTPKPTPENPQIPLGKSEHRWRFHHRSVRPI